MKKKLLNLKKKKKKISRIGLFGCIEDLEEGITIQHVLLVVKGQSCRPMIWLPFNCGPEPPNDVHQCSSFTGLSRKSLLDVPYTYLYIYLFFYFFFFLIFPWLCVLHLLMDKRSGKKMALQHAALSVFFLYKFGDKSRGFCW